MRIYMLFMDVHFTLACVFCFAMSVLFMDGVIEEEL